MWRTYTVLLIIVLLVASIIWIQKRQNESFIAGAPKYWDDLRQAPQDYGPYKNLALTSKPIYHNLPSPIYEWWEHLKPYNLLHQPDLYKFNPKDNDLTDKLKGIETDTRGSYPFCIYGNQKKFCSQYPETHGCPNNWLSKIPKKVSWGDVKVKTF